MEFHEYFTVILLNCHIIVSKIMIHFNLKTSLGLPTIHSNTSFVTFTSGGRGSENLPIFTISNCHNWGMEGGSPS